MAWAERPGLIATRQIVLVRRKADIKVLFNNRYVICDGLLARRFAGIGDIRKIKIVNKLGAVYAKRIYA